MTISKWRCAIKSNGQTDKHINDKVVLTRYKQYKNKKLSEKYEGIKSELVMKKYYKTQYTKNKEINE